ncbi:SDR family NAD(P)-dependent oxidoreductase [Phenylobacterium sp.]|uniref:SDR family NAD(P)-dependent oxidoreductase n=1 Tax=Phenylobacterium sp. TaxID=1871053 RepID=UPI00356A5D21
MSLSLDGKVAVVTGASTGLGRGIALALAARGACVVVGDLTTETRPGNFDDQAGTATADLIAQRGGKAVFRTCDVTDRAQVEGLIGEATKAFGRLDVLVNNAGVHRGGTRMHELTEDDLDACWRVLGKGTWFAAQEALKAFLAQGQGGSIINIVSTAGLRGHLYQSPYNMAKAAQANLTRCLALEYGVDNIRTNAICPTYLKTAMSRSGFSSSDYDDFVVHAVPLGRWGEVSDVASLAVFLASDEARFINGALIPVDGGETAGAAGGPR